MMKNPSQNQADLAKSDRTGVSTSFNKKNKTEKEKENNGTSRHFPILCS